MSSMRFIVVALLVSFCVCQKGTQGPCSAETIPGPFTQPISVFGSTPGASTLNADICDFSVDSPTVWFSITPGVGSTVNVTTCSEYSNFDTVITVISGNCYFPTCVGFSDDNCYSHSGTLSTYTFTSTGEEYLVGVGGYGSSTGNFELTVTESGSTTGGCSNAIVVPGPYSPVTIFGNTDDAPGVSQPSCGLSSSSHVNWYQINPPQNSAVTLSTCSQATTYDTLIAVFSGSCSSLTCVTNNDDNCTNSNGLASGLSFFATESSYLVAVSGFSSNSGDYLLTIQANQASSGGGCENAPSIDVYAGSIDGDTTGAAPVPPNVPSCDSGFAPANWYQITSYDYTEVMATTCAFYTNFDTILQVYQGSSCDNLDCITYNDDDCEYYSGLASTVNFSTSEYFDVYTYIVVTGFGGSQGSYTLTISPYF